MQFDANKHKQIFQRQQNCSSPKEECNLWSLKIYKRLSHQIEREIKLLLVNNVHENIAENQDRKNFLKHVCRICNLQLCYNFALMLHENALIFSQSEVCNFFMSIIS